jgi:hypothetical protein
MSDAPGAWVKRWMQEREAENAAGIAELLRHPECRTWLCNLIETLADVPTFDRDPLTQAYLQGRRSVGMDLRETAQKTNFELYYRMLGERANSARLYLTAKRNDADKVPLPKE